MAQEESEMGQWRKISRRTAASLAWKNGITSLVEKSQKALDEKGATAGCSFGKRIGSQ
jgi:hypothetical protein